MALLAPEPPQQAAAAVRSTLESFASAAAFHTPALRSAEPAQLQLTQPHQVFTMGLADLAAGRGLEEAQPAGWRYLVSDGTTAIASAESVVATGGAQTFSQFNEGPFVASTAEALATAPAHPAVGPGSFEVRLLHVPGLYTMALWLHDTQGTGDLLVPLAPSPVETPAGQPVPADQLLAELRSKAAPAASVGPADRTGG